MTKRWTIAFDADDTLWHNERFFETTTAQVQALLATAHDVRNFQEVLRRVESRNLALYGYGIKGFTLSVIETAIEISGKNLSAVMLERILELGRDMLAHPIDLLPNVEPVLVDLAARFELLIVTKGDLLDQQRKVAQSGLRDYFGAVDIVSEKSPETYQHIFARYDSARMMMVGNSLKSDIIPALEVGAWGVWLSNNQTWAHEAAPRPVGHHRYHEIKDFFELPDLLSWLG